MFDGEKCIRCWKWHKFEELTAGPQGFSLCRRCAAKFSTEGKERRRCPDDNRELVKRAFFVVAADKCETCGGIWLDGEELQALVDFFSRNKHRWVSEVLKTLLQ